MRLSLKLAALCSLAATLPLLVGTLLVVLQVSTAARGQVLDQLQSSARSAAGFYDKRLIELKSAADRLADTIAARALVSAEPQDRTNQDPTNNANAWARLQDLLPRAQNDYFLDFVIVTDATGRVIARHNDKPAPGESMLAGDEKNALVDRVINAGNVSVAACAIERGQRYQRLWLDRVAHVNLADGSAVDEALVAEAAAPVFSGGRFVGVVLIGQMLNTYWKPRPGASAIQTPLVAEARQALARTAEDDTGVLISNHRGVIASSIPPSGSGNDPLLFGSLIELTSQSETLTQGDRSYIVAWQPLKSVDGAVLGRIGVARPAIELTRAGEGVRSTMLVVGFIAIVLFGAGGFVFGRILGSRIERLHDAASRWSVGDLSMPTADHNGYATNAISEFLKRDEIADLSAQMEQMRISFRHAIERLRRR
jgi:HAMP domain-containing protein